MRVKTITVHSAGGVVLRGPADAPDVLMIATHNGTRWALPKGQVEPNESLPEAARREVEEETGIKVATLAHLETIEYWYYASRNVRHHKFVDYFLMKPIGGTLRPQLSEVDDVRWWPLARALELATYENDRRVIEKAGKRWPRYADPL